MRAALPPNPCDALTPLQGALAMEGSEQGKRKGAQPNPMHPKHTGATTLAHASANSAVHPPLP
eukprot:15441889-Alexandrium_andersonii.AAC.1